MNLIHLKTFQVMAEELNFTRAAIRLNYSQPTVSKHIQALEKSLGLTLLKRSQGKYQLTRAGQEIYSSTFNIFKELQQIETISKGNSNHQQLRLQAHDYYCYRYFLPAIEEMVTTFPNFTYKMNGSNNQTTVSRLLKSEIDIGIISGNLLPKEFDVTIIGHEDVIMGISKHLYRPGMTVEDYLSHYPLVIDETEVYNTQNILPYIKTPYTLINSDSDEIVEKAMLNQKMIGVVRSGRIEDDIRRGDIIVLDTLITQDPVYLITSRSTQNLELVQTFCELVAEHANPRGRKTIHWL